MKSYVKLFGVLAFIILSLTACAEKPYKVPTHGSLIITGLGNYIGTTLNSFEADVEDSTLYACSEYIVLHEDGKYGAYITKITDNSIILKLYNRKQDGEDRIFYSYNGNHENVIFKANLFHDTKINGTIIVNFTDGMGEGVFIPNLN